MDTTELLFYAAAIVAATFVGLSKGGLPVVGSLGVPIMALTISPIRAAGLLLPIFVISDIFGLWVYRHQFDRRNIAILVPPAILGVGFGWATASWMPEAVVTLLVGVIGAVFCILRVIERNSDRPARPADVPRGMIWGALAGFTSFVAHQGAPPFQMYVLPQKLPKLVFAGTNTIVFAIINAAKLVPYAALGQFSPQNLRAAAILIPFAVAGTFAGAWLTRIIPDKLFFRLVTIALFLISVKLIVDGLRGLL